MGKTKTEEYDALIRIRGILKDFNPEDTYIGKAFEGCVEKAEDNICNDLMLSFRSLYESRDRDALRLNEKLTEVTKKLRESEVARVELVKQLSQKDDAIARYEGVVQGKDREISRLNGVINDKDAAYTDLEGRLEGAKETADGLKQTILELKAKLYDMMTAGEEVKE
jgi:chromosome segregation ATPase